MLIRAQTNQKKYPPGWNDERVQRVLVRYEQQSEEEAVAEDEAAFLELIGDNRP